MDKIEYLKNKNGIPIKCGFENKYNNFVEKYLFPYYKLGPLFKKHYNHVYNSELVYECDTNTGIGFFIKSNK